jgi:hypothetical protein
VLLAASIAIAGFVAGRLTGLAIGVLGAGAVLYAGVRTIKRIRRLPEDSSPQDWLSARVDALLARPTTISGPNPFHPDTPARPKHRLMGTTRIIHGNIREVAGKFWAEYRVETPMENGRVSSDRLDDVLAEHKSLMRVLLRQGAFIGRFKEPIPYEELMDDSFTPDDPDVKHIPLFAHATVGTLDESVEQAKADQESWPHREVHVVALYVGDNEATAATVRDEIIARLPFTWQLMPASPAQMYWSWYRHCTLGAELPDYIAARAGQPAVLPDVEVDDGARTDAPFRRRLFSLKADDLTPILKLTVGDSVSYQAVVTAKLPDIIDWPDTDFLSLFAHMKAPINVAIRCSPKDRVVVEEENRRADTKISDNQQETEHLQSQITLFGREEQLLQM